MTDSTLFAVFALLGLIFVLSALGAKLPTIEILKFLADNSREMAYVAIFTLFLGFLFLLSQTK